MERLHLGGRWSGVFSPSTQLELESLSQESDDLLYQEGLLSLARREENSGHLSGAAELYSAIISGNTGPLREQAQLRLDAILGRGNAGARAEFLLRNLAQQASDPAAIFAMGAAGTVFRMTRLAALSRFALSPQGSLLSRSILAPLAASGVGFLAEAPAFTLASRLGNAVLGREQDWSFGVLGREFAGGAITLLGLKVFGGLSGMALRRYARQPGFSTELLRNLLPQAAMFSGILLSHRLETRLGLRERMDGATEFTDAFATLLQFHAGGRLAHQAFGEGHRRSDQLVDLQSEALVSLPRQEFSLPEMPSYVFSMAANSGRPPRGSGAQLDLPYESGLAAPRRRVSAAPLAPELQEIYSARAANIQGIRESLDFLSRQGRALSPSERIAWIREHRLAGGIPLLGEQFRENGAESHTALAALRSFAESHRAEVLSELRQSLRHPQLLIAAQAIEILVALRASESLPELRELSTAFPAPLGILAETARVDLGDVEMIPILRTRAFTWQRSALDRISALEALGRLGESEAVLPELRGFFRYGPKVYVRAGLALTRLGHHAAIPNPAALLDMASPLERGELADAFWENGRTIRARELWQPLLESGNRQAQEWAIRRAVQHRISEGVPAFRNLATESLYPEIRRQAAEALIDLAGEIGDLALLEEFLEHREPSSVQATEALQIRAAQQRLAFGAFPPARELLESYLESPFAPNRLNAAAALLQVASHAEARRVLEAIWQNPEGSFEIRQRAFAVAQQLQESVPPIRRFGNIGGLALLLAGGSGLSLLFHPALAEASFGPTHVSSVHDTAMLLTGLGTLLAGGIAMAMSGGSAEGPRRNSDRPPHANLLAWFENPSDAEERYFLATPPENPPENQGFLSPPEPGNILTLGRATGRVPNLFPAHLRNVSRRHMDLQVRDGVVEVRIHNGSQGLRINGRNLAPFQWYQLRDRDSVEFVSEGGRDVLGVAPSEEIPGEFVTVTRRLGRQPLEERDAPAVFLFRLPRPLQTPVPPRPRRNLLEQFQSLFSPTTENAEQSPVEEKRDSRPVAAFHDPEEIFGEIRRFSEAVSTPIRLLEESVQQPDWLDPNEERGAPARRDVLRALIRIHRQICGNAEQIVPVHTPASGISRPSYQSLRVPRWDGILRQRLETYRQGLEQLRESRGTFPLYTLANQELSGIGDQLNRLFELVRLFRRHFHAPEEQAQLDAIEAAYRGLRPEVVSEGHRVRTDTRGIDVTVRRQQRQLWSEEFSTSGRASRAMVNMRILMGDISEVQGVPVAGSLYSALSNSTVYDSNTRSVRVHFDAGSGHIVAFDDGSPRIRQTLQRHRDQGRRLEEAMLPIDAQGSGRIGRVVVLGEVRDSIRIALEGLQGLRVLPPQTVLGATGFAGEADTRMIRVNLVPDVDAAPEHWYRVAGLVRNVQEGWSLLTLEANSPELGLPGMQVWVPSMEILDLAIGDPVTAETDSQ